MSALARSFDLTVGFHNVPNKSARATQLSKGLAQRVRKEFLDPRNQQGSQESYVEWTLRVVDQVLAKLRFSRGILLTTLIVTWFTGLNRDGNVVVKVDCLGHRALTH